MREYLASLVVAATVSVALVGCGDGEEGTAPEPDPVCSAVSILTPVSDTVLVDSDDADKDCRNGVQVDVQVATNAPDGARASLSLDGEQLLMRRVSGASVIFEHVTLPASGTVELTVAIGGVLGCEGRSTATTLCKGPPSCEVVSPVLSATHPTLNNVPEAEGGDRSSPPEDPHRVTFEVETSAGDGQWVALNVDDIDNAEVATVVDGVAVFPRVTFQHDGDHTVGATCFGSNGKTTTTEPATYPVDTMAPNLVVQTPEDDYTVAAGEDVDPRTDGIQFSVCGTTTARDAVDLPQSLGPLQNNLCAQINQQEPVCARVRSDFIGGQSGGCAVVTCPDFTARFTLTVRVYDDAGNYAQQTVQRVRCE